MIIEFYKAIIATSDLIEVVPVHIASSIVFNPEMLAEKVINLEQVISASL